MEASKLRNILADLTIDADQKSIDTLSALVSYITTNQNAELTKTVQEVKEYFSGSIVNNYSPSNFEILNSIGGLEYFGNTGMKKIEQILTENSYNIQKTVTDLQAYIKKRNEFIAIVIITNDNLKKLNIQTHFYQDEIFEVGILMPTELTKNKIQNITKELNHWDKIFKTFKELTGTTPDDTEINFVSNGSLQFFIENSPSIGACLAVTIERVVKLYKNITEIRAAKEKLKDLGISQGEQKLIDKQEKDFFNKEIEKISLDIIKEFVAKKIDQGRLNELKIALKGHVTYIAKSIDNGMIIEINPPEIEEPRILKEKETPENKEDKKNIKDNYDKTLKQIEIVQKSMDTLKTIGKTGLDIVKYITDGESSNDED